MKFTADWNNYQKSYTLVNKLKIVMVIFPTKMFNRLWEVMCLFTWVASSCFLNLYYLNVLMDRERIVNREYQQNISKVEKS